MDGAGPEGVAAVPGEGGAVVAEGRGEIAAELGKAAIARTGFPASVPDTPANRELFARIQAEVDEIEASGLVPDIPPE